MKKNEHGIKIWIIWTSIAWTTIVFSIPLIFLFFESDKKLNSEIVFFTTELKGNREAQKILKLLIENRTQSNLKSNSINSESAFLNLYNELKYLLDKSNLILDPDLEQYHLMSVMYIELPSILKSIHKTKHSQYEDRLQSISYSLKIGNSKAAFDQNQLNLQNLSALTSDSLQILSIRSQQSKLLSESEKNVLINWVLVINSQFESLIDKRLQDRISFKNNTQKVTLILWISALISIFSIGFIFILMRSRLTKVIFNQENVIEKSAKLVALGEMAGGIGHEIANPLAVILSSSDYLKLQNSLPESSLKALERIDRMVGRINSIIKSMKIFIHKNQSDEKLPVSIKECIEDTKMLCDSRAKVSGVTVQYPEVNKSFKILGNDSEFAQVLVNLTANAIDAAKDSEKSVVILQVTEINSNCEIDIMDSGLGISKNIEEKIFEPLFTTKEKGKGTGLGLPISKKIIEKMNGEIKICPPTLLSGAHFKIILSLIK